MVLIMMIIMIKIIFMFEVLRYLNRNQLKELSSDIFRNNTQLIKL